MRLLVLLLLLALPASAHAVPVEAGATAPLRERLPELVAPIWADVGYGEAAARFGNFRRGHVHAGQDVFAPAGTPLRAVRDGVVLHNRGADGGRGHYVGIYSPQVDETYVYFHMRGPSPLAPGDRVIAGDLVGRLGCTGSCFGDHLHFEIRDGRGMDGEPRDPLPLIKHASKPEQKAR